VLGQRDHPQEAVKARLGDPPAPVPSAFVRSIDNDGEEEEEASEQVPTSRRALTTFRKLFDASS
jgi:hypothetical protein